MDLYSTGNWPLFTPRLTDVRGIKFTQTWVRTYDGEYEKLDQLRQLTDAGKLTLRVAGTVAPKDAAMAHAALEAGGSRGRWVIMFDETN